MKKLIAMLLALVIVLALTACEPNDNVGTTAGTTGASVAHGSVHCICGANDGEDHIGACTGEKVEWTPWTGTTLPTETGYYYAAHETDEVTLDYTDYTRPGAVNGSARDIVVDLNGKTYTAPGDMLIILDPVMTLTLTDSSAGHNASIVASEELTLSGLHDLIHMEDSDEATTSTTNIYRVTLDASALEDSSKAGSAIAVEASNVLNMYHAVVLGGSISTGNGGAIWNAGTVNLCDTVVYGAEITSKSDATGLGGAIYTEGDLNLVDCTIYGAPALRGGALCITGGNTTMAGGIMYGADVSTAGCAVNMKANADTTANFVMKSSDKGEPVIDCSGKTSGNFGGAINIDGYNSLTHFTMESGQIIGGTAVGASAGGAILVQDTMNNGKDGKGIFTMNGGTVSGGIASAGSNGGGNIRVTTGGVAELNGGTITGGQDAGDNKVGGIKVEKAAHSLIIGGTVKITGNEGNDIFLASGKTITVKADWAGNGDEPLVIALQNGTGVFAVAEDGASLTDAQAAFFAGNVKRGSNTLALQ